MMKKINNWVLDNPIKGVLIFSVVLSINNVIAITVARALF